MIYYKVLKFIFLFEIYLDLLFNYKIYLKHIYINYVFNFRLFCSCSVDMRGGMSKAPKRWSDETVFGERAFFAFENEPGKLSIEKVNANDSGIYRCRVDFLRAQTYNTRIMLNVISKLFKPVTMESIFGIIR